MVSEGLHDFQREPGHQISGGAADAQVAATVQAALLDQGRGGAQDFQGLLETLDLRSAVALLLRVALRHDGALGLDLSEVLQHGIEPLGQPRVVGLELGSRLIEGLRLLSLVLDVALLGDPHDVVLLRAVLMRLDCGLLLGGDLGQVLREVRLAHLQQSDDPAGTALGLAVRAVLGVVILQDLECKLDALQARVQLCTALHEDGLLFGTQLVHFGLALRQSRELLLQSSDLLLELRGLRGRRLDLRSKGRDLVALVVLLGIRLHQFLVAKRFLRGLRLRFLLEP
mmetsp:Transcript_74272/g.212906  ORF Transcript_74272/g.212906 Transcript_74272/m.212906 type:complete len:284 (-) Transcript_74272:1311-2162(-)